MLSKLSLAIGCLAASFGCACGATIDLVGRKGGLAGIKIEGDIEPGDAVKLLRVYEYFGQFRGGRIFLFSRGGDMEEAIKLGGLIRRLRLTTYAPERNPYENRSLATDKTNNICASACVLI